MKYSRRHALVNFARKRFLGFENRKRLTKALPLISDRKTPVFIIVTPEISHFTPYCIQNYAADFQPVLLLNGMNASDTAWVREAVGEVLVISLKNSFRRQSRSLVPHVDAINDLFSVMERDFCIQDPDCFVTDPDFWHQVSVEENQFASGPFWEPCHVTEIDIPQTFFLMLNSRRFRLASKRYGIDSRVYRSLPKVAADAVAAIGYKDGVYPRSDKDYFDTLQAYWGVSYAEGLKFKQVAGVKHQVFHIGGTSYLMQDNIDLTYGEFWPLSVHYFNLRLLERGELARFRGRYENLFQLHGSADQLLLKWPGFRDCWRSKEIDTIVESFAK